jgi:hypothetical protein
MPEYVLTLAACLSGQCEGHHVRGENEAEETLTGFTGLTGFRKSHDQLSTFPLILSKLSDALGRFGAMKFTEIAGGVEHKMSGHASGSPSGDTDTESARELQSSDGPIGGRAGRMRLGSPGRT